LEKSLENALNIYNSIKHSTTGFPPELLFHSDNKNLFKKKYKKNDKQINSK